MGQIKVAAAPVSWGVFEKTEGDPLQLSPEVMLDQMAAAGYEGTELGPPGFFGTAVHMIRRGEAGRTKPPFLHSAKGLRKD